MLAAALMVMVVAAINLALLRLGGSLWDVITVQHDAARMTQMILLFLGLVELDTRSPLHDDHRLEGGYPTRCGDTTHP